MLLQELEKPRGADPPSQHPLLINHHDEQCERLSHLKPIDGLDPLKAELEMMGYLPLTELTRLPAPGGKQSTERAARLQELVHFITTGGLTQAGTYAVVGGLAMETVLFAIKFNCVKFEISLGKFSFSIIHYIVANAVTLLALLQCDKITFI